MASVSYNGQCFSVDGRRVWVVAATLPYARIVPEQWAERIAAARRCGFNTIEIPCPWLIHEPRRGRYTFEDQADIARFVSLCAEAKLWVVLRIGPYVGEGFDGGGLPGWLTEDPVIRLREHSEALFDRLARFYRRLFSELAPLQATKEGPILLVQTEHAWECAEDTQATRYLRDVGRIARECGVAVPLINANNLWADSVGTIDTWRGTSDLLANLRQLRALQPQAPRLVRVFEDQRVVTWGEEKPPSPGPTDVVRTLAEVFAAGAQPIVSNFHGGTNFGFLGGQLPGSDGATVTTAAVANPLLGEAGHPGETYHAVRPVLTFADQFAHVFTDLDPDYHPVSVDATELGMKTTGGRKAVGPRMALTSLRGAGGRVVFVFTDGTVKHANLLLTDGVRLPVDLSGQKVSWFVQYVDLHGSGRLDYANLCPLALVDRSIVVLFGAPRAEALLSVDGSPLTTTVPSGNKPTILRYRDVTLVICNQKQIDATHVDEHAVYVGVDGLDEDGKPIPAPGWAKTWVIRKDGKLKALSSEAASTPTRNGKSRTTRRTPAAVNLKDWAGAPTAAHAAGTSPRFASLPGPQTLPACGATTGYGWYRFQIDVTATKKRLILLPQANDRVHLFVDGELAAIVGRGPGAEPGPVSLRLERGRNMVTALVDNLGSFADGNDPDRHAGLYGHLHEVKAMRLLKPKLVEEEPVNPFTIRGFVLNTTPGGGSAEQAQWSFSHAKKAPLILDVVGAACSGTFLLNGTPIAYYAGDSGAGRLSLVMMPAEMDCFKRGNNILRFAPDHAVDGKELVAQITAAITLYESVANLTAKSDWSLAKWEPPITAQFKPMESSPGTGSKKSTPPTGVPTYWRCRFKTPPRHEAIWLETGTLSKGQVFLNGNNLGRYFSATATRKAVGPQTRLAIPPTWFKDDTPNDLLIFDEHGFSPAKVRLVFSPTGDLD